MTLIQKEDVTVPTKEHTTAMTMNSICVKELFNAVLCGEAVASGEISVYIIIVA